VLVMPIVEEGGGGLVSRQERFQVELGESDVGRRGERRQRGDQVELAVGRAQPDRDGEADVVGTWSRGRHVQGEAEFVAP
jgi:hypothetical protein